MSKRKRWAWLTGAMAIMLCGLLGCESIQAPIPTPTIAPTLEQEYSEWIEVKDWFPRLDYRLVIKRFLPLSDENIAALQERLANAIMSWYWNYRDDSGWDSVNFRKLYMGEPIPMYDQLAESADVRYTLYLIFPFFNPDRHISACAADFTIAIENFIGIVDQFGPLPNHLMPTSVVEFYMDHDRLAILNTENGAYVTDGTDTVRIFAPEEPIPAEIQETIRTVITYYAGKQTYPLPDIWQMILERYGPMETEPVKK